MSGNTMSGVAVVTGGASGIGAACCRELAARGATVAVVDRDADRAAAVARETKGRVFTADVGDEASVEACAAEIERTLGPVEILINSAGIVQMPLRPTELPLPLWDQIVHIDQRGTYVACVAFGRRMIARRRGSIVNIASITGSRSAPLHAYAPAKAAVIATTKCLAAEWGPAQVRVNSVSPGYTRTPALQDQIDRGLRDVSRLTANAALGRMVEPEDIARAVCFLAGPEAAAITGVDLVVDCGWMVGSTWNTYGGLRQPAEQD